MAFESAMFRPVEGSYDADAVRAHLDALPYAFVDPVEGRKYHLSGSIAEAQAHRRARLADPSRFPYGVLVELQPEGVLIDQAPLRDALARGRQLVQWLYARGHWRVQTEHGDLGADPSLERLYPEELPDPDTLDSDPFTSPPPSGVLWSWRDGDSELLLHDSGALRLEGAAERRQGKLSPEALARWEALADGVDPDAIDGDAQDPEQTASLSRETPEEEASLYYDRQRVPAEVQPLIEALQSWRDAVRAWTPGAALPGPFVSLE